jgi:hypothetical protein
MTYDDASWHYGGDFPEDLPEEAGGTHIGMFFAWAWLNGFAPKDFGHPKDAELIAEILAELQARAASPGKLFFQMADEKFSDKDMNVEGNAFAAEYYAGSGYLSDFEAYLADGLPSIYHVPDTWETYDKLAPVLKMRLDYWRLGR